MTKPERLAEQLEEPVNKKITLQLQILRPSFQQPVEKRHPGEGM